MRQWVWNQEVESDPVSDRAFGQTALAPTTLCSDISMLNPTFRNIPD